SASAAPGAQQIYEPSPMPQQPTRPSGPMRTVEPAHMAPTVPLSAHAPADEPQAGGVSRFSTNVSGSWLEQEETPSPSEAPDIVTTPAPYPRTPPEPEARVRTSSAPV